MQTVNRTTSLASLRNGNGKRTKRAANQSNATTGVLRGVQNVMLHVLHGGDLELGVGIASEAKLHEPPFSGLLHKQIGMVIQNISLHRVRSDGRHLLKTLKQIVARLLPVFKWCVS